MASKSLFERIPAFTYLQAAFHSLNDTAISFFDTLADVNLGERQEQLQPIRIETRRNHSGQRSHQK